MAALWWMSVLLVFFPSVGSRAAVDQNKLADLIQSMKDEYAPKGIFCLALSIRSEDPADARQIFEDNPKAEVNKQLSEGAVYKGKRLAVAKVQKPEHAELRVLKDLNLDSDAGDLLVIFSSASACPTTCTNINNPYNIIEPINDVINKGKWSSYVFVFEKIFKPEGTKRIAKRILIKALQDLGTSKITLPNIFRCFKLNNRFQCTSCSNNGVVTNTCVDYDALKSVLQSPKTQK